MERIKKHLMTYFFLLFLSLSCSKLMGPSGTLGESTPNITPPAWNQTGLIIKANGTALTNILHNLGEIERSSTLTTTFTIENKYSVPVNLTGATPIVPLFTSPYYTVVQPSVTQIPANGSVTFDITFNPSGSNTSDEGNVFGISIPNDSQTVISFYILINTPWHFVGNPVLESSVNGSFDLKLDKQSKAVYIAYQKDNYSFDFKRYISGSWALLPSINPGNLFSPVAAMRLFIENGIVYFAAKSGTSIWLYKYENYTWTQLFNAGVISDIASPSTPDFGFAVHNGIAYIVLKTNGLIKLLTYDTATSSFITESFGDTLSTAAVSPNLSLEVQKDALGNENVFFNFPTNIAWPSANLGILHCTTTNHALIASDLKKTDTISQSTLKVFNNEVYLAYLFDNSKSIYLEKWNGSSSSLLSIVSGPDSDVTLKSNLLLNFSKSMAYIAYLNTSGAVGIIKQNGSAFIPFGDDSTNYIYTNSSDTISQIAYDSDGNGTHYIIFKKSSFIYNSNTYTNILSVMSKKD